MMKQLIVNGKIVGHNSVTDGNILIENGIITTLNYKGNITSDISVIDADGGYIMPGFVEIHAHGGGGYDFIDNTPESFEKIFEIHKSHGVTTICPTLTACRIEKLFEFLDMCKKLQNTQKGFAGVHLEGPFLSKEMCGAQNLTCIIEPTNEIIEKLKGYADVISRITVAPEINNAEMLVKELKPLGVSFSIGHSNALADSVYEAFKWGCNQVTHLFSSTSQRTKLGSYVYGGIIETVLSDDNCFIELIADGHHVSKEQFMLVEKCVGLDRICAVSDAMRAAGLDTEKTESFLGEILPENRVILEDGVAKLPDRSSFAGSLGIGNTMVKELCGRYGIPIWKVSRMLSTTPAKLLGLNDEIGQIKIGYKANITILDCEYQVTKVIN